MKKFRIVIKVNNIPWEMVVNAETELDAKREASSAFDTVRKNIISCKEEK